MNTDTTTEYKDMFGRDIKVGDYIVYAGLADRSAVLRAGRVIELTFAKEKNWMTGAREPKIKVESWNNFRAERGSGKQKAVSLGFLDRLIVVPESFVSEKVKSDLDGEIADYFGNTKS